MSWGGHTDNRMQGDIQEAVATSDRLFDRIGRFLDDHRLSPDPTHYAFVHAILTKPDGALAKAVASLVDDGVRLHQDDIVRLGGPPPAPRPAPAPAQPARTAVPRTITPPPEAQSDALAAQTQNQVETFAAVIRAIQADTSEFGADLARNAEVISRGETIGLAALARLTGAMLERVNAAELRLEQATAEAETLREKLAEARATARRDPLTGLANRLAFNEALGQCFQASRSCHLALCDIDRFKRINDAHGHQIGDRVLSAVARTLSEECQKYLVVRHGGEEFAILIHGLTLADAAAHLDGARSVIAGKRFRLRETDKPLGQVTLSIGVTAVQTGETIDAAFERAYRLLYTAKSDGRDRVCAA